MTADKDDKKPRRMVRKGKPQQIFISHRAGTEDSGRVKSLRKKVERKRTPKPIPNRLKELRKASGLTVQEIADAAHITVNHYRKLEDSVVPIRIEYMTALAEIFRIGLEEILEPRYQVPVLGFVVGDGQVEELPEPDRYKYPVPTSPEATEATVALIVRGNAMGHLAHAGWILYFEDVALYSLTACYGLLCVVETRASSKKGRKTGLRVRHVLKGDKPDRYNLISPGRKVEQDKIIKRCSPVGWMRQPLPDNNYL